VTAALDRALPTLTVRAVQSTAVMVPMRFALGTSAATVREAPLLLIDLLTEEGVTGRSYLFCYRASGSVAIAAVLHEAAGLIAGDRLAPVTIAAKLKRAFTLIGVTGVVRMALSALDMALWDALAVAAGLPLATMLGAAPRPLPADEDRGADTTRQHRRLHQARLQTHIADPDRREFRRRQGRDGGARCRGLRYFVMPDAGRIGGSPGGCRRRAWRRRAVSKCRRISCRRRAPICSQRPRPPIGSNTWIGRTRSWPNRWRSSMTARLPRHPPGTGIAWNHDAVARYRTK